MIAYAKLLCAHSIAMLVGTSLLYVHPFIHDGKGLNDGKNDGGREAEVNGWPRLILLLTLMVFVGIHSGVVAWYSSIDGKILKYRSASAWESL